MNEIEVKWKIIKKGLPSGRRFSQNRSHTIEEVKNWMDFRSSFGEDITGESWIIRDIWQSTSYRYCQRVGLAQYPKKIKKFCYWNFDKESIIGTRY